MRSFVAEMVTWKTSMLRSTNQAGFNSSSCHMTGTDQSFQTTSRHFVFSCIQVFSLLDWLFDLYLAYFFEHGWILSSWNSGKSPFSDLQTIRFKKAVPQDGIKDWVTQCLTDMNDVIKVSSEMFFFCGGARHGSLVDRWGNQRKSTFAGDWRMFRSV